MDAWRHSVSEMSSSPGAPIAIKQISASSERSLHGSTQLETTNGVWVWRGASFKLSIPNATNVGTTHIPAMKDTLTPTHHGN